MPPILTNDTPTAKRLLRRPPLACLECRQRKIKCDRNRPCNRCTKSGSPTCTYTPNPRTGTRLVLRREDTDHSILSPSSTTIEPSIQVDIRGQPQTHRAIDHDFPTPISSAYPESPLALGDRTESSVAPATFNTARESTGTENHVQALKRTGHWSNNGLSIKGVSATVPGFRGMVCKSRLFGQSHWTSTFLQFDFFNDIASRDWRALPAKDIESISHLRTTMEKCKALAKREKPKRPEQVPSWPELLDSIPSREVADKLVDNYFRAFESVYRILHIPSFQSEYQRFWKNKQGWYDCEAANRGFAMKLLLVLAIGFCLYPKSENDAAALAACARQWIYFAISWISAPVEKDLLTMTGLQVQCLIHLARLVHNIGANLVCISVNTLLDTAILMGLHRDPVHFLQMTDFTAEMRRRLWATIIEMTIQSELGVGRCVRLSAEDFDTKAPANINDDDISENSTSSLQSRPKSEFTQTSLQIILFRSWKLRLEVIQATNNIRSEPSYDEVLRLTTELMTSNRDSLSLLKAERAPSAFNEQRPTPCDRNLYECLYRRFMLSLHRPFASKARKDPRYYFSRKICTESSLIVLNPEPDEDYHHIISFAAEIFREVPGHAGSSLCLEALSQLDEEQANMTLRNPDPQREQLKAGIRHVKALLEKRLERADFSVQGVVFMAMVLAQIEAVETGVEPRTAVIEAARTSAAECYEVLRIRTGVSIPDPQRDDDVSVDGTGETMCIDSQGQGLDFDILDGRGFADFDFAPTWLFPGWGQTTY